MGGKTFPGTKATERKKFKDKKNLKNGGREGKRRDMGENHKGPEKNRHVGGGTIPKTGGDRVRGRGVRGKRIVNLKGVPASRNEIRSQRDEKKKGVDTPEVGEPERRLWGKQGVLKNLKRT